MTVLCKLKEKGEVPFISKYSSHVYSYKNGSQWNVETRRTLIRLGDRRNRTVKMGHPR